MGAKVGYVFDDKPCSWSIRMGGKGDIDFMSYDPLDNLRGLIRHAKKFVPGWNAVDLSPDDAAAVWRCFNLHQQQEFRQMRPFGALSGWMISVDGVDVYESPAPGEAAPPLPTPPVGIDMDCTAMWFGRQDMGDASPPEGVPGVYIGDKGLWSFYVLSRQRARQWASMLHRYAAGEAVPSSAPGDDPHEDFRLAEGE